MTKRRVALCLTVLNEADNLTSLFASVGAQTRQPDEIVIVDGGSTDGTAEVVRAWHARGLPIALLTRPGANISAGRNAAIRHAEAPLIAVTDAGVRLEPGWLSLILQVLAACLAMTVVLLLTTGDLSRWFALGWSGRIVDLCLAMVAGVAAYFGVLWGTGLRVRHLRLSVGEGQA